MKTPKLSITNKSVNYGYKPKITIDQYSDKIPKPFIEFAIENIRKEFSVKRYGFRYDPYINTEDAENKNEIRRLRNNIKKFKLDDDNIWQRELNREQVECPRSMMMVYYSICSLLDIIFKDRPIDRFWFLETVARMPYFSYVAILHMYETLGWWDIGNELKKAHYKEEQNETHHLRIMESLGGDALWWNRFLARHGAVAYYIILLVFFMITPKYAYLSSELLERHAVDTYTEFSESNKELLTSMSPTKEALEYMPYATNLYDVFCKISLDELNHAVDMEIVGKLPK